MSVPVKNDFHDTVVSLGKYFTRKSELPEKLFLKVFYKSRFSVNELS